MSDPAPARVKRPWTLSLALYVLCGIGLFGFIGSCNELDYLRGSQALPDAVDKALLEQEHPLIRAGIIREKARLEAVANLHQRTFPLSAARCLLSGLLFFAAVSALMGRRQARSMAVQATIANGAFAIVAFALLGPVREAVADAMAEDATNLGAPSLPLPSDEQSFEMHRQSHLWADRIRFVVFELGIFLAAAAALSHPKNKAYWLSLKDDNDSANKPSTGSP